MKKFTKAVLASSVLVASLMSATAARADTATADARANILQQVTAAGFDVTGTAGETVSVASDPTVTLTSGTNSMTANIVASASTLTLTGGTGSFNVGGLLNVGANQADGAYEGSFNVTVNYN